MKRLSLLVLVGFLLSTLVVAAPAGADRGNLYQSVLYDAPYLPPALSYGSVTMDPDHVVRIKIQTDAPDQEFYVRMEHGGAYLPYPVLGDRLVKQLGKMKTDAHGKGEADFDLKTYITSAPGMVVGPNFVVSEWLDGPPTFSTAYAVIPPQAPPPPPPPQPPLPAGADQGSLVFDVWAGTPTNTAGHVYQSFVPTRAQLTAVELRLRTGVDYPNGGVTSINIRRFTPTGDIVGSSTASVPLTAGNGTIVRFDFVTPLRLTPDNWYVIEWLSPGGNCLQWAVSVNNPYRRGTYFGPSGVPLPIWDAVFVTY